MQRDYFLETSALVDLVFRRPQIRDHLRAELGPCTQLHTSRYVIFELSRGYLKQLLVLHNKASDLEAFSSLLEYVKRRNIGPQYAGQTMLGAYSDFIAHLEQTRSRLTEAQRLAHFRAWLALLIRSGWRVVHSTAYSLTNPMGCKDQLPAPIFRSVPGDDRLREHVSHDLPTAQCGQVNNCSLVHALQSASQSFQQLVNTLQQVEKPDAETLRRVQALQRLLVHPLNTPFQGRDCHSAGDAIIAHECSAQHTIVSKNERHFEPLCASMGKALHSYKEPPV